MAYMGGSAIKVRENEAVAEMSRFRLAIFESARADLAVRPTSSFCQIPEWARTWIRETKQAWIAPQG
jgi:hypothetical protein